MRYSRIVSPNRSVLPILLLICSLILLSLACQDGYYSGSHLDEEMLPGDSIDIREQFSFYLHKPTDSLVDNSIMLPENGAKLIITDTEWQVPDGFTVTDRDIEVEPTDVTWTAAGTQYTYKGYRIKVKGKLCVNRDAKPENNYKDIKVIFKNLDAFKNELGLTAIFPSLDDEPCFTTPDMLKIKSVEVCTSRTGIVFKLILGLIAGGLLLAGWFKLKGKLLE